MLPSSSLEFSATPFPPDLQAGNRVRLRNLAAEQPGEPLEPDIVVNSALTIEEAVHWKLAFGANVETLGVNYRVWGPDHDHLEVDVVSADGDKRRIATVKNADGWHEVLDEWGRAGDRYAWRTEEGALLPDPASRYQPTGVHERSLVVDAATYEWQDKGWQRPVFRDLVLYELHIGTFTPEGTFRAAMERLGYLQELGINAIEIMPLADFPGQRNWGYDGVFVYAPARCYGTPEDLRALVDAAHGHGIAVILDVVYNHVGPDGSSLEPLAAAYFDPSRPTPWGSTFNFDGPGSAIVREFFSSNPVYWMEEFHVDGFRLDATHAIQDRSERHVLAEIAARVHARGGYVIAEDERNLARLIEPEEKGGYGFDAVWADDFHHSVRVGQTREQHAYLQNFSGTLEETVDTLKHGWRFRGQLLAPGHAPRGTEVGHIPPSCLIHCISNHDQSGNRAFGERVSASIPADSYRAISMLLCLTPYTPMFFMGQEWAATTPFLFFADHNPALGMLVTEGRRREFAAFPQFNDPLALQNIPDPQDAETFLDSKLLWEEAALPVHAGVLELYRRCLHWRNTRGVFRPPTRQSWDVGILQRGVGYVRMDDWVASYLLVFHLWPEEDLVEMDMENLPWPQLGRPWELLMSSNDRAFGGKGCTLTSQDKSYVLGGAETLLMRSPPGVD